MRPIVRPIPLFSVPSCEAAGEEARSEPEGMENTLIDEIRKLTDGVYLGVDTAGLADCKRSEPGHFVLMGSVGQWVGVDDYRDELK